MERYTISKYLSVVKFTTKPVINCRFLCRIFITRKLSEKEDFVVRELKRSVAELRNESYEDILTAVKRVKKEKFNDHG